MASLPKRVPKQGLLNAAQARALATVDARVDSLLENLADIIRKAALHSQKTKLSMPVIEGIKQDSVIAKTRGVLEMAGYMTSVEYWDHWPIKEDDVPIKVVPHLTLHIDWSLKAKPMEVSDL